MHLHIFLQHINGIALSSHTHSNSISSCAEVIREVTHGLQQKTPCSHIFPPFLQLPGKKKHLTSNSINQKLIATPQQRLRLFRHLEGPLLVGCGTCKRFCKGGGVDIESDDTKIQHQKKTDGSFPDQQTRSVRRSFLCLLPFVGNQLFVLSQRGLVHHQCVSQGQRQHRQPVVCSTLGRDLVFVLLHVWKIQRKMSFCRKPGPSVSCRRRR